MFVTPNCAMPGKPDVENALHDAPPFVLREGPAAPIALT
jgi:hypothetical protein